MPRSHPLTSEYAMFLAMASMSFFIFTLYDCRTSSKAARHPPTLSLSTVPPSFASTKRASLTKFRYCLSTLARCMKSARDGTAAASRDAPPRVLLRIVGGRSCCCRFSASLRCLAPSSFSAVAASADEEKGEEKEAARWRKLARLVAKRIAVVEGFVVEWDANERSMVWVLMKPPIVTPSTDPLFLHLLNLQGLGRVRVSSCVLCLSEK